MKNSAILCILLSTIFFFGCPRVNNHNLPKYDYDVSYKNTGEVDLVVIYLKQRTVLLNKEEISEYRKSLESLAKQLKLLEERQKANISIKVEVDNG